MKSMCRTLSLALACLLSGTSQAATVVDLLFQGVANAQVLTVADRQAIAALLPMAVGPAGLVDRECKQPSNPVVTVRDMNRDGRAEVIVVEGNGCIYGMMGKVVHALASDGQGRWRGFCYPVYGYADAQQKYVLKGRVPDPKMPNACKDF